MRFHVAAVALAVALPLAACSSQPSGELAKAGKATQPAAEKAVDCEAKDLSQAEWVKNCASADPAADQSGGKAKDLQLGTAAETLGSGGTGVLEMTPSTVVYVAEGGGETPDHDLFAVVAFKARPTTAAPAAKAAQGTGGGWQWAAPDGLAISEGDGSAAFNVVPVPFSGGGEIQPGTFQWDSAVFDITEAQRGGTLIYVDGDGVAHRWRMPKRDAGPQVEELRKALAN